MLAVLLLSSVALAESSVPEGTKAAELLVKTALVEPLAKKDDERSKFTRGPLPPTARRIRILDENPGHDANGAAFYTFAVDAKQGFGDNAKWRTAAITGCVYVGENQVFVKSGDRHRPAAFLLGKNLKPVAETTCTAAPTTAAVTQ